MKLIYTLIFFANFAQAKSNPLDELVSRLDKLYDSSEQASQQMDYFDVTLDHCEIGVTDLPNHEKLNKFMLLEQAISANRDNPYRIRLIKIEYDEITGVFMSKNFEPSQPEKLIGGCLASEPPAVAFSEFSDPKCTIYLEKVENRFEGGTPAEGCFSDFRGATTFTAEVIIGEDFISSWDRGFDSQGNQVWGARRGPYLFREVSPIFKP